VSKFEVGDYVLYVRVRRRGVTPKLMATRTGSWRVVAAHHPHVFEIQNSVSGRVQTARVARLRFYADSQLNDATMHYCLHSRLITM
ncbi:unnamed protein product, partial [Sphacelaria rigidula]